MIHMRSHRIWFDRLTNGASARAAAEQAGLPQTTLSRQLKHDELSAEFVISLCRAYDTAPIHGLIATGYLANEEGGIPPEQELAQLLSDQGLLREQARRIDDNPQAWVGTFDEVIASATPGVGPGLQAVADSSEDEREGEPGDYDA